MLSNYVESRKLEYTPGVRGDFVRFIQHIHDKVRTGEVKKLSSPLTAFWSITARCNLCCKHCYAAYGIKGMQNDLCLSDALKIVDVLADNHVMEIVLQGGEPFCYDHAPEIICAIKNRGMAVSILTNGTLLNDRNLQCINTCLDAFDILQISLDGSEKSNDFIRGKGVFQKVVNNLKKITFQNIVVNCVVTNYNLEDLPTLCELLNNNINVSEIHFSPLMKIGRGKAFDYPKIEKAMETFLLMKKRSKIKISGSIIPDSMLLQKLDEYGIDMTHVKLGCCAGRSKVFIDHLGYVHSCDYSQSAPSDEVSLLISDFHSIWENSWKNQVESSYNISKKMAMNQRIERFCPNYFVE